jgi:hypothetical protein
VKRTTRIFVGVAIIISLIAPVTLVTGKLQISFAASSNVQNFMNMTEEQRIQAAKKDDSGRKTKSDE